MKREHGIIKEIYLLEDDTKIGFKILVNDKIIDIVETQNSDNANIYKDDKVIVITDTINKEQVITITLDRDDING